MNTIGVCYYDEYYYGAFSDCVSLTSIEIPAQVTAIGPAAFKGCSRLTTVTFEPGSQLEWIGGGDYNSNKYGAFALVRSLKTVDMSNCTHVTSIKDYAFYCCTNLQLFKIGTSIPPKIGTMALQDVGHSVFSILKVPSSSVGAYKAANGWNQFANITGLDE